MEAERKINIYKTIEKAITADYLDSIADYVAITSKSMLVRPFKDKENLLSDVNNDEFKKIIDDALNNDDCIYISLAKIVENSFDDEKDYVGVLTSNGNFNMKKCNVDETSDYGILINKFLFFRYVKRFEDKTYDDFVGDYDQEKVTKFIHDCIVYEEKGEESFHIMTYEEWLDEMKCLNGFNELSDDLKKALYEAEYEIDMHLDEVNEYEMRFWYGGGVDDAPWTGDDMVDDYLPEVMLGMLGEYIFEYIDEDMELYM